MRTRGLRLLIAGWIAGAAGMASAGYVTIGQGANSKWDDYHHGTPAVITWGFVPDGTAMAPTFPLAPEVTGTSQLGALRVAVDAQYGAGAFDDALERALHTWELVAGVTFVGPMGDPGLPLGAAAAVTPDIRIAAFAAVPTAFFAGLGAVGYGPPGFDDLFPDPVAGDVVFNLTNTFRIFPGAEGAPFDDFGNDVEGLFLHELGHAAMGLGHPASGPGEVMYVGAGCCGFVNRVPSPDDITGARVVYGLSSTPACQDGIDDDGDGRTDHPADPGCASAADPSERGTQACDDGVDNDEDGKIDAGSGPSNDPGCYDPSWSPEDPACSNGLDDDGDTLVDLADPQCGGNAWQNYETPPPSSCGLLGAEALLGLAAWRSARPRRGRSPGA
jgi:hypothetical protein